MSVQCAKVGVWRSTGALAAAGYLHTDVWLCVESMEGKKVEVRDYFPAGHIHTQMYSAGKKHPLKHECIFWPPFNFSLSSYTL